VLGSGSIARHGHSLFETKYPVGLNLAWALTRCDTMHLLHGPDALKG
jgi:hypothetical protein